MINKTPTTTSPYTSSCISSNLPLNMVLAIGVDHPPVEVDTELPPNPLPPASGMVPAMPTQMVSVNSPGPELATPSAVSIILRSKFVIR